MECNKEQAEKCKALSEADFKRQDLVGAKKYALKARRLFPELEGLPQLLSILEVHIAAHHKLKSGEANCYGILQVDFQADDNTIRKQYRKLALILHPDKNKAFGAEAAFKHISEAWSVLSDRQKRLRFDRRWREDMAARAGSRVSMCRVNIGGFPNMNSVHGGRVHVHPQQRAHAQRQQGHIKIQQQQGQAYVHPQQGADAHQQQAHGRTQQQHGHGQAHVRYQQGQGQGQSHDHGSQQGQRQDHDFKQGHEQAYQEKAHLFQQGCGQAHVPYQQGRGHELPCQQQGSGGSPQGQKGQAHVPVQQGQGQTYPPQQKERDQVHLPEQQGQSQGQGQAPAQHQQEQGSVHAQRQQCQDATQAQGTAYQAHAHEQQGQGQVHVHQEDGQEQTHSHVQQGQGQMHAQHQQKHGSVLVHHQQGQVMAQAQGQTQQQQGKGLAHSYKQQGQDPTQAQSEAHQAAAPQNHLAEHNQAHGSKPFLPPFQHSKSTFWTACPSCRMQLEYESSHMDKKLCCPMCYKAFVSKEIAPVRGTVLWPPQSKPDSKMDVGTKSSLPDITFDQIPSTSLLSVHSNKKAKIGAEDDLQRLQHGHKILESPPQPAQEPVELQQNGLGSMTKYELRKRVAVHAKEALERHTARSKNLSVQKLSEEKERMPVADKMSAICRDQMADRERSGCASGLIGQNKPVASEKEGYVHNTQEIALDADACNSGVRTCKSAGSCKEAEFSKESPGFAKRKPAGMGIPRVESLQRKRKSASPMNKSIEDQIEGNSTFVKWCESHGGSKSSKLSDKSSVQVDVSADEVAGGCKMEVPDPDFHNFDGDRTEHHFATGQIWASYDDDDGMPRYYARVNKILSLQPLKMQMNWLEVCNPSDETQAWLDSGFQHSCGDFQLGSMYIAEGVSTFSHPMLVDRGLKCGCKIYPRQGDVWAVYKDWEILKAKEDKRGYDMVEIVAGYDEDKGVQVSPLFKVAGFKTIFERNLGEEHVKWIPPQELRRFSHQVPAHRIAAVKIPRIQVDCLELDPASTPMNLIYGKQQV